METQNLTSKQIDSLNALEYLVNIASFPDLNFSELREIDPHEYENTNGLPEIDISDLVCEIWDEEEGFYHPDVSSEEFSERVKKAMDELQDRLSSYFKYIESEYGDISTILGQEID